jgi:hypothetical protein
MDVIKAMIIGPEGSPYWVGANEHDCLLANDHLLTSSEYTTEWLLHL